jgi:pSer/pThr/pTyr-binding forkhead associated (FHA) protein
MAGALNRGFQGQDAMKSFLTACGLEDSLQLALESQTGREDELRLLSQPFAIIGRDPRADVVLDHSQVSRRHVYLQVIEGRPFWLDLESRTGTRGDRESQRFGWLAGGKPLWVGPYVIRRFSGDGPNNTLGHDESPREPPLVALAYNHAPLPEVALEFLNGPSQSMSRPVHRVMSLIGSTSGCKFRLTDPSVSRFHACLLRTSAGMWIIDLLGQSGVFVNEEPVRFARLADGDLLRIGRYQIRVRCRLRPQGSGPRTSDYNRAAVFSGLARRKRGSSSLQGPDWNATPLPAVPRSAGANALQYPMPMQADTSFPKSELMPFDATLPDKLAHVGSTESVLAPLVSQFGMMQQQMFDQFQQAIAMMVQMFGEMHRDQMKVIREELDRLHELTDELNELRNQLANRSNERPAPTPGNDVASVNENRGRRAPAPSPFTPPPASGTRATETWDYSNGIDADQILQASSGAVSSAVPITPARQPSLKSNPSSRAPVPSDPLTATSPQGTLDQSNSRSHVKTSATNAAGDNNRDTVVWLHQRIIALQDERTSRWQRILKLLPGASS